MENNNIQDFGDNNVIEIGTGFDLNKVKITIKGNNNKICIKNTTKPHRGILSININADDSEFHIDEDLFVGNGGIYIDLGNMGYKTIKNSKIIIGKNLSVGGLKIITYNSNVVITLGSDIMTAWGVYIYATDSHPIYDIETGKIVNKIKGINIGDNCWLGADCKILKNVTLKNNTIVGFGSVVTKSFDKENIAIGGNPARLLKENVSWKRYDEKYIDNEIADED